MPASAGMERHWAQAIPARLSGSPEVRAAAAPRNGNRATSGAVRVRPTGLRPGLLILILRLDVIIRLAAARPPRPGRFFPRPGGHPVREAQATPLPPVSAPHRAFLRAPGQVEVPPRVLAPGRRALPHHLTGLPAGFPGGAADSEPPLLVEIPLYNYFYRWYKVSLFSAIDIDQGLTSVWRYDP